MTRRPDHLGRRKDFRATVKQQARERAGYVCQYPGCDASAFEVDHILPQGLGGKSSLCNAQVLCADHHKQKSRQDVKVMAKADRAGGRAGQYARRKRNGSQIQSPPVSPLSKSHPNYRKPKWPNRHSREG